MQKDAKRNPNPEIQDEKAELLTLKIQLQAAENSVSCQQRRPLEVQPAPPNRGRTCLALGPEFNRDSGRLGSGGIRVEGLGS